LSFLAKSTPNKNMMTSDANILAEFASISAEWRSNTEPTPLSGAADRDFVSAASA
jgi:hypothetical protein